MRTKTFRLYLKFKKLGQKLMINDFAYPGRENLNFNQCKNRFILISLR